jgi:hypothetical protein
MQGKIRTRLALLVALAALSAVLVPAGIALGSHTLETNGDFSGANEHGVLRLQMNDTNGDSFIWTDGDSTTHTQAIESTRCEVSLNPEADSSGPVGLVTFDLPLSGTSDRGPGYKDHEIGVKSGGSQGVDCSQVDSNEWLHLSITEGLLSGLEVSEAQLDIEAKGDLELVLQTYSGDSLLETIKLRSGGAIVDDNGDGVPDEGYDPGTSTPYLTFSSSAEPIANCRDRSDSGPDSTLNDNCRWVIQDMVPFDGAVFTTTSGEFSLAGGVDGTPAAPGSESFGSDSLFYLTDITGVLDCYPASADIGDSTYDPTYGTVTMRSQDISGDADGWLTDNCLLKPYNAETAEAALSYVPSLSGTQARYTIDVTVEDQEVSVDPSGMITSLTAVYNADGDLTFPALSTLPLPSCQFTPITNPADASYDTFWQQESPVDNGVLPGGMGDNMGTPLLPSSDTACFYMASVMPTGVDGTTQIGTEHWSIYFEDDPGLGFR